MLITFYLTENKARERMLAEAMEQGCKAFGHDFERVAAGEYNGPREDTDVACFIGIKGISRRGLEEHWKTGAATIFIDKGYARIRNSPLSAPLYWRVSVNSHQPLRYFKQNRRSDRWDRLGIPVSPLRTRHRNKAIFAGSSLKYHMWNDLVEPTQYAQKQIKQMRKHAPKGLQMVYRPKPSWHEAVPIPGAQFSRMPETLQDLLREGYCLVTHGSNAAVDALIEGVPAIVLGGGIASAICANELTAIRDAPWPGNEAVQQFLYDIAYCQWTIAEMASGEAWDDLKEQILS